MAWPLLYLVMYETLIYHKRKTKELLNRMYGGFVITDVWTEEEKKAKS